MSTKIYNNDGNSPLDLAIDDYNYEMINLFLQKYAEQLLTYSSEIKELYDKIQIINQLMQPEDEKFSEIIVLLEATLLKEKDQEYAYFKFSDIYQSSFSNKLHTSIFHHLLARLLYTFYTRGSNLLEKTDISNKQASNRDVCMDLIENLYQPELENVPSSTNKL